MFNKGKKTEKGTYSREENAIVDRKVEIFLKVRPPECR